jgi:hypothetical protein
MVVFGAPQEDPDQEEHAFQAALEMQKEMPWIGCRSSTRRASPGTEGRESATPRHRPGQRRDG